VKQKIGPKNPVLKTDKRIRLGIWGLGRGMYFYRTCAMLNIDVVAGCDFNEHMRATFHKDHPEAFVTDDAAEFLKRDFDAVLLATYCPAHADDAIRCLRAGKHVLSEVTSFHTMAEGVRLVEAVENSGLVYNLAENYPFTAANMYLARKWREGLFGKLMYAEYEYVHECRSLCYTYIDGLPIIPGNTVHNWRSWLNFHYYNTHSLGPMMIITGNRPTRVVALPAAQTLAGYPMTSPDSMGGITPSLINMDNGAVVRNLMGATTNDSHTQRIWGTLGSAEIIDGRLRLRLGASGESPKCEVIPHWDELGEMAAKTGHGGGDFWVLYYFARHVLLGEPGPFDIYKAADCTIPGILAYRSSMENGKPFDVPDFRDKSVRRKYRSDTYACPRYDIDKGCFPKGADARITGRFSAVMKDLIGHAQNYRAYADWSRVAADMKEPKRTVEIADRLLSTHPEMLRTIAKAQTIIAAYPRSDGARVMREMLGLIDAKAVTGRGFVRDVRQQRKRFARLPAR
jgi:predicted dehydrogenase